jgi:hypothetical protein
MEIYNAASDIIINQSERDNNIYNDISSIINDDRAIYNRNDTFQNTKQCPKNIACDETNDDGINNTNTNTNINIYRYKFTDEFTDELFKFSKIHQYDERKVFKEAWSLWMDDNDNLVNSEYRRLKELGYNGDIFDKMFKSARYYFRKKSTEKKEPAKRRIYVGTQKDLLEAMDDHIRSNINSGNFKPSEGFDEFCKENVNLLKEEVTLLCRAGLTNPDEIKSKIKKTYKNRYFLAINK